MTCQSSFVPFCLRLPLDSEPVPDQVAQLAQEVYNSDLLQGLATNMAKLEFEVSGPFMM